MNILVLTDFSDVAYNASRYSLFLARSLGHHIMLLHAESGSDGPVSDGVMSRLEELQKNLAEAAADEGTTRISYLAEKGTLPACLGRVVREYPVDLIVMGASDGKALPGYLFGDRVRSIIATVNRPLLLIPEQAGFGGLKHIFYATDLRYLDRNSVSLLATMAIPLQSRFSLLHVCAEGLPDLPHEEALQLFGDAFSSRSDYPLTLFNTANDENGDEVVNRMVDLQQLSILAVANRKHHFFSHIFSKTPGEKAPVYKIIPLLVLPVG